MTKRWDRMTPEEPKTSVNSIRADDVVLSCDSSKAKDDRLRNGGPLEVFKSRGGHLLTIRVERMDGLVILHCQGRLGLGHETDLLCSVMQRGSGEVIVDLREVTAIDSAGVGALISLQAAGFYLTLTNPAPIVREVLASSDLDSVFEIAEGASGNPNLTRKVPSPGCRDLPLRERNWSFPRNE